MPIREVFGSIESLEGAYLEYHRKFEPALTAVQLDQRDPSPVSRWRESTGVCRGEARQWVWRAPHSVWHAPISSGPRPRS